MLCTELISDSTEGRCTIQIYVGVATLLWHLFLLLQISSPGAFTTRPVVYLLCTTLPCTRCLFENWLWSLEPPMPQAQLETRPGHGDQLTKFRDLEVLWIGENSLDLQYTHLIACSQPRVMAAFSFLLVTLVPHGILGHWPKSFRNNRGKRKGWPVSFWVIRAIPFHSDHPLAGVT